MLIVTDRTHNSVSELFVVVAFRMVIVEVLPPLPRLVKVEKLDCPALGSHAISPADQVLARHDDIRTRVGKVFGHVFKDLSDSSLRALGGRS